LIFTNPATGGFVTPHRFTRAVLPVPFVLSAALLFAMSVCVPAHAALGGRPIQTPAEATVSTAPVPVARAAVTAGGSTDVAAPTVAPYSVIQTTLASGTVVREYVSRSGTVFGIAWSGPHMPNLSQLLGSYFPQFASGAQAARAAGLRGAAIVDQRGLVVRSGGHMGSFVGQAWLPQALPNGVAGSDIQ
jgi:hypothetical protein